MKSPPQYRAILFSLLIFFVQNPVSAQNIGDRKTIRVRLYVMNDSPSWMSVSNPRYRIDSGWAVDTKQNAVRVEVHRSTGNVSGPTFSIIDKGDSGFDVYRFSRLQTQNLGANYGTLKVDIDAAVREASSIQQAYSSGGRTVLFIGSAAAAYDNTPAILGGPYRTARGHIDASGYIDLVYVGNSAYWAERSRVLNDRLSAAQRQYERELDALKLELESLKRKRQLEEQARSRPSTPDQGTPLPGFVFVIRNLTGYNAKAIVRYLDADTNEWVTRAWYTVKPQEECIPKIATKNRFIHFRIVSSSGDGLYWTPPGERINVTYEGVNYEMGRADMGASFGVFKWGMNP